MFEDFRLYDPNTDSKVPLKRTPFVLVVRILFLVSSLFFSGHPKDCWVWLRSMASRKRPLSYIIPWVTFGAARAISSRITDRWSIFEYGSGHSTLYWARLGARVISIENNQCWYELLTQKIRDESNGNIKVILAKEKTDYIHSIDSLGDHQGFDMVFVDGAYRRECIISAIRHVKAGGYLVVDNTDWHWFQEQPIEGIPENWEKTVYPGFAPMIGHKSETTIWTKPKAS